MATNKFIEELKRRQAEQEKLGGFNAQPTEAPGLQPQTPMVQPESVFNAPAAGVTAPSAMTMQTPQDQLSVSPVGQPAQAVQAPQGVLSPEERTRVEGRLAQTNADIVASGGTVPSLGAVPEEPSFLGRLAQGFRDQNERIAQSSYSPMGGVSTPSTAVKNVSGFGGAVEKIGGKVLDNFSDEAIINRMAVSQGEPIATLSAATPESAATEVAAPSTFTETPVVQSPNTQTRESVTATGIGRLGLDPSVTGNGVGMVNPLTGEPLPFIQGVNGTMNQQALLPEGLTASSPIPEGLVKAIGSDGRMILTSPAEAARLNAIESQTQKDDRAAQQKFLASDKAREFSNRQIRSSIMGDGQYGRDSLAREARQAARPDFGEAQTRAAGTVTDRERRAARGEGMSDADRRDIAKANIRGASASDIARAMKVAELNNVDLQTGKSLDKKDTRRPDEVEQDRLNLLRTQQIIEDGNKPDATKYEKDAYARQLAVGKGIINQAQADDANKRDLIGNPPSLYDSWAEYEAKTKIDQDKDGKVSTEEDAKAARLSKVELSRLQELLNKNKK